MQARERIILALDVDSLEKAMELVRELHPYVGCFKVGLELLTSEGAPRVVEALKGAGGKLFYDGKFCDIPNTVAGAARAVAKLGVEMFNVHASAGREAVVQAVANKGNALVLGVTVLTSIDEEECCSIFGDIPPLKVCDFARMLAEAGADGVICSPKELEILSQQLWAEKLLKVVPGVRPTWAAAGDQKRVMTPGDAVRAGADYLVIGRPITKPPDEINGPTEAAERIAEEIASAM